MAMTLRAARHNAGLTAEEAAEKIGVSRDTLYRWEQQKSYPTANLLQPICTAYGCSVDELVFCPEMTD